MQRSWLDKCPVCKKGELRPFTQKELFGLIHSLRYVCSHCGAMFVQKGEGYELKEVIDDTNPVWIEYGGETLTEREWRNIANGGMSDEKQREADMEVWLSQLKEGKISIGLAQQSTDIPIILKKNEKIELILPNLSLMEPRRVTTGGYGGPSMRVAKGLYFRVGAFRAQSHEEIKEIDNGLLALTNKRLVFLGDKRNANIDLKKIVAVEPYKDGIAVVTERRKRPQYFIGVDQDEITVTVEGRSYREPLTGLILMYLIDGLVKKLG